MPKRIGMILILALTPAWARAKLRIVTSTTDLAALAGEVGGNLVEVESIAKGYQDPHFVDPKPSYLLKLNRADLFIQVGLELEVGWAPPLLTNARNPNILPGKNGFLEAAQGCDILQKNVRADRSLGDVHPFGNPHLWTDPENGRIIARGIAEKLVALDPEHEIQYRTNLRGFEARLTEAEKQWERLATPLKGVRVVTYHNSWPNFCKRFGLEVSDHVEPRPGIPPSPSHIKDLIREMREAKIPLLIVEPYFDVKLPQKIADETGARLVILPPSVGGTAQIQTYFDLFNYDIRLLLKALGDRPGVKS